MTSGLILIIVLVVLVVLVLALVAFGAGIYNRLVALRNRYKNAFGQIEVQLQRRHDLVPNLVETAKAYMSHERETLEAVIAARNQAVAGLNAAKANPGDARAMGQLAGAEGALGGALGRLFAVMEAYPDLKANQSFLALQEELTGTEGRIAYARQFFNDMVLKFNTKLQTFPANLIAKRFGFVEREYFETQDEARGPVQVDFGTGAAGGAPTPPAP